MAGAVSTVAGNGVKGFADEAGLAARFNCPTSIVVDGVGTILVDKENNRLRKIVGGQVMTLAGSSEPGTSDGAGSGTRFNKPYRLALDERGRLLVLEYGRENTLWVVEAFLVPPLWMGPVEEAAEDSKLQAKRVLQAKLVALEDYGKMVEDGEMADVVLLVEGKRFPAHRVMFAARSEYFRDYSYRGCRGSGRSEGGVQEIELREVSSGAFRVVLRYLYSAELPESRGGGAGARGWMGEGDTVGGGREGGKKKGKGDKGKGGTGAGGDGEEATAGQVLERAVLKAPDLRVEGLLRHCLEAFGRGLKVDTAVEQLVWAHNHRPSEARTVATEYFVRNGRRIQTEQCETMALLKLLPVEVNVELMQTIFASQ